MTSRKFYDLDLVGMLAAQDVNHTVELLTHNINVVLNELAPLKKRFMKTSAHWMTPELRSRIKIRNSLRFKAVKTKQDQDWRARRS